MRIEIRQIILEHGRRVALGIDGDEQRSGAVGVFAERLHDVGNLEQGRRADVGAMGEAEKHQERPPLHVLVAERLAGLVFQVKRTADGRDRAADRRCRMAGQIDEDAQDQHQPGEERADNRQDAGSGFGVAQTDPPVSRSTRQSRRGWSRRISSCRNGPRARPCPRPPERSRAPATISGRDITAWCDSSRASELAHPLSRICVNRSECGSRQPESGRAEESERRHRPIGRSRLVADVLFRAGVVERRELLAAHRHDVRRQAAMPLDPTADFRRVEAHDHAVPWRVGTSERLASSK